MGTANAINMRTVDRPVAGGLNSRVQNFGPLLHRNSQEEWLALSDDDFIDQVKARAELALNSPLSSWDDVKNRVDKKIRDWTIQYAR